MKWRGGAHCELGFRRARGQGRMPAMFPRVSGNCEVTTVFSVAWGTRERGRRRDSLPVEGVGGGWSSYGRRCASAAGRARRSTADKTRKRGHGEAPGQGRKVGGKREEVGSPWAPNRCGDARRRAELRREIPPSWQSLLQGDERAMEEECWGIL
jgi:hypothetical protein